jgi:1,4-alpha-glucan branching enzyme
LPGEYVERLNSDAEVYGGSNAGNEGRVVAVAEPSHGHQQSLSLTVPPLGFLVLRPEQRPSEQPSAIGHRRSAIGDRP